MKQWLTETEKEKILSLPDKRETRDGGLRDYNILNILFNTGIRKSELCNLDIGDLRIDGNNQYILLVKSLKKRGHQKGKTIRAIPLKDETVQHLKRYLKAEYNGQHSDPDLPMFETLGKFGPHKKRRITSVAVHGLVKKYAQLAGINKNISTHSFRHSFATHLLVDRKVDLCTVQELLGHNNIGSTQIYLHTSETKMREAIELL